MKSYLLIFIFLLFITSCQSQGPVSFCEEKTDVWTLFGDGKEPRLFDFGPSDCYFEEALRQRNEKICDQIDNTLSSLQETCKKTVERLILFDKQDPQVCVELSSKDSRWKSTQEALQFCYWEYVETYGDARVCDNIEDVSCQARAQKRKAILENSSDTCNTITEQRFQQECYRDYAIARGDVNICLKMVDEFQKGQCLDKAGFYDSTLSMEHCQTVQDKRGASRCFQRIAWNTGDAKICKTYAPEDATHQNGCDLAEKYAKEIEEPVNNTRSQRHIGEIPPPDKIYQFSNIHDIKDKEWGINPYGHY